MTCEKVLNLTILVRVIWHFGFKSKIDFKMDFQLSISCPNLSQKSIIFRKLNHFQKCGQQNKGFSANFCIITQNFTYFQQTFHSPQGKLNLISSVKKFIVGLSHKLPNDLKLDLRKYGNISKIKFLPLVLKKYAEDCRCFIRWQ